MRAELRQRAGERSFQRGEEYFRWGQVAHYAAWRGRVAARVLGTRAYRVSLWREEAGLAFRCECPVGEEGRFCKHAVALGLAWLAHRQRPDDSSDQITLEQVNEYLSREYEAALVEQLMAAAMEDEPLRQRLCWRAAKELKRAPDLESCWRELAHSLNALSLDAGTMTRGDVGWEIEWMLAGLLEESFTAEVQSLTERLLNLITQSRVRGGLSRMKSPQEVARCLWKHHLDACRQQGVEARSVARRALEWQLNQVTEGHDEAWADEELFKRGAALFGEEGEIAYQQLVEEHWRVLSHIAPAHRTLAQRRQLTWLTRQMESWAKRSGSLDEVAAVKREHLSEAETYLELAELYRQAGKDELAIEWAQRGLAVFPVDARLRELLIGVYESGGRMEEALAEWWERFVAEPSLHHYRELKARALSLARWPRWREQVFEFLRQRVGRSARRTRLEQTRESKKPLRSEAGAHSDHSELVRIWLAEGEVEAAWQAAQQGICANDLWLTLAARRMRQHPEESLAIYQGQIKKAVNRKNVYAYKEAVRLLRRVRRLMKRLGREEEFSDYLKHLCRTHLSQRNFVKLVSSL